MYTLNYYYSRYCNCIESHVLDGREPTAHTSAALPKSMMAHILLDEQRGHGHVLFTHVGMDKGSSCGQLLFLELGRLSAVAGTSKDLFNRLIC